MPWHKYKDRILETAEKFAFSKMFGWTPKQIDDLSEEDRMEYRALMSGFGRAKPGSK